MLNCEFQRLTTPQWEICTHRFEFLTQALINSGLLSFRRQIEFVLGSVFSALMGVGFNLYGIRLKEDENFGKLHHAALGTGQIFSLVSA